MRHKQRGCVNVDEDLCTQCGACSRKLLQPFQGTGAIQGLPNDCVFVFGFFLLVNIHQGLDFKYFMQYQILCILFQCVFLVNSMDRTDPLLNHVWRSAVGSLWKQWKTDAWCLLSPMHPQMGTLWRNGAVASPCTGQEQLQERVLLAVPTARGISDHVPTSCQRCAKMLMIF